MKSIIYLLFGFLFLVKNLNFACAYLAADKITNKMLTQKNANEDIASIRKIPTESEIIEFSINPAGMILGVGALPEKITFRWLVKTVGNARSKTKISIEKSKGEGPDIKFGSDELQGEYSIDIPKNIPEGKTFYLLTVNTEQYNTNIATAVFDVKSLQFALEDIDLNGLSLGDISDTIPEDTVFDLFVSINNRANLDITAMKLKIILCRMGGPCEDNPASCGEIPITIFKGHRNYRLPLKFRPLDDPGWTSLKVKLLHSQTNILLKIWEFPLKSEQKRVYSLM